MNKRLQGFVAGILCCVLFAGISVFAKNTSETIQALYKDIKIYVDGVKINPKDANGNTVEPFIYNGTTYLPVRAVGEAIDKQVTWDGATSSVYLGDVPGIKNNWMEQCPPYQGGKLILSSNGEFVTMGGKKYTDGFTLGYSGSVGTDNVLFNLDSKYKSVTFDVGNAKTNGGSTTICCYLDGKLSKTIELSGEDLPKTITIPLNYSNQMKIEVKYHGTVYGFMNGFFE